MTTEPLNVEERGRYPIGKAAQLLGISPRHIARLAKSGWEVAKSWIDHWANGKKVYIAELEKNYIMTSICPDIPDNWSGGRSATARLLEIDPKTLDKYVALGPKKRGIGYTVGKSGKKKFSGREIKRFWKEY